MPSTITQRPRRDRRKPLILSPASPFDSIPHLSLHEQFPTISNSNWIIYIYTWVSYYGLVFTRYLERKESYWQTSVSKCIDTLFDDVLVWNFRSLIFLQSRLYIYSYSTRYIYFCTLTSYEYCIISGRCYRMTYYFYVIKWWERVNFHLNLHSLNTMIKNKIKSTFTKHIPNYEHTWNYMEFEKCEDKGFTFAWSIIKLEVNFSDRNGGNEIQG